MKIKFLGTSAGWPLPRLGCSCEICTSTDPKDMRTRSQALINDSLLLDIGPDTYRHLATLPSLDKLKYAAITHEHPDHTFGLWDLGHIYGEKPRPKIKIIINEKTFRKARFLFFPGEYEVVKALPFEKIKLDNDLTISLFPVNHTKDSSFGHLVEEDGKRFFWAPDFKSIPDETKRMLKGVDLLALDGSELRIRTPGHETILEGIQLGKELEAKQVYFIHIGHRTLPQIKLEKFLLEQGVRQFHVAYDGLEINI